MEPRVKDEGDLEEPQPRAGRTYGATMAWAEAAGKNQHSLFPFLPSNLPPGLRTEHPERKQENEKQLRGAGQAWWWGRAVSALPSVILTFQTANILSLFWYLILSRDDLWNNFWMKTCFVLWNLERYSLGNFICMFHKWDNILPTESNDSLQWQCLPQLPALATSPLQHSCHSWIPCLFPYVPISGKNIIQA